MYAAFIIQAHWHVLLQRAKYALYWLTKDSSKVKIKAINRALHIFAFDLKKRLLKRKRNVSVIGCGFYIQESFYINEAYHNLQNMFRSLICYFPENAQQLYGQVKKSSVDIYVCVYVCMASIKICSYFFKN